MKNILEIKTIKVAAALCIALCAAHSAPAAPAPLRAAFVSTPVPTPTAISPAATMSSIAPANFDPAAFGQITTETLPLANGQPIVARVNGEGITWQQFMTQVRETGANLIRQFPDKEDGIAAALAGPVMDALVLKSLYRQYASEHSLTPQPSEIKERAKTLRIAAGPPADGASPPFSQDELESMALDSLLQEKVNKYLGDAATSTPATSTEITSITETITFTTNSVEITRASHIVIRATPDMSEFAINDAKAKAAEILQKIRDGLSFYQAARQYSQDRFTAYMGGNIGYYAPGAMYPEFEATAKNLKIGEVSEVVRTPVGFHIIQVTERHPNDLLLQIDKYRKAMAVLQWKQEINKTVKVENYLRK